MNLRLAPIALLALMAVPAVAQTVYSNGPTNGNTDAWQFNFGFVVSDTFNVSTNGIAITGASFGMWLYQGDIMPSVELSITSQENGGTDYFDQTVNFTQSNCTINNYGYNVCTVNTTFSGPTLNSGTYWLNLQNPQRPLGYVLWDENSGPSQASSNVYGSIPSESFTVLGGSTTSTTTTTSSSVPEPSSIMLMGSGVLGLGGILRRRLF